MMIKPSASMIGSMIKYNAITDALKSKKSEYKEEIIPYLENKPIISPAMLVEVISTNKVNKTAKL